MIRRRYGSPVARGRDLERLAELAATASSRGRFVADLTLDPPVSTGELAGPASLDDDWLVVHVIHASDGSFPSDLATGDPEALAEERRLFYVAVTRARDVLEVNVPVRYHHHRHRLDDRHGYAQLSRFLSPEVRALTDTLHAGAPGGGELPGSGSGPAPGVEVVDSLLAELWS